MKSIILTIGLLVIYNISLISQCTNCNNSGSSSLINSSVVGSDNIASGSNSFAGGSGTSALGAQSFSFGFNSYSSNNYSITIGTLDTASGVGGIVLGTNSRAGGTQSLAIGNFVQSMGHYSMVIGSGFQLTKKLKNLNAESLMIGFNSTLPTLSVSTSEDYTHTGKVGIGNIVNELGGMDIQAKLHLRADESEIAAMLIEPYSWAGGSGGKSISENGAYLFLGNSDHSVGATSDLGLLFNSESNYIFGDGNVGAGVDDPKTKLHVNGDIMFENDFDGMIMKSPDGQCWKGNMSNEGELVFISIDCESLSGISNKEEDSQVFIYPNPASDKITVEYTGDQQSVRLKLYTINNALISTHKIYHGDNTITVNDISSQMIIATIIDIKGKIVSSEKIIIHK